MGLWAIVAPHLGPDRLEEWALPKHALPTLPFLSAPRAPVSLGTTHVLHDAPAPCAPKCPAG
eukprot:6536076-Alexandrium_andersonii.AAC.1